MSSEDDADTNEHKLFHAFGGPIVFYIQKNAFPQVLRAWLKICIERNGGQVSMDTIGGCTVVLVDPNSPAATQLENIARKHSKVDQDALSIVPWTFVPASIDANYLIPGDEELQTGRPIFRDRLSKQAYTVFICPGKTDVQTALRQAWRLSIHGAKLVDETADATIVICDPKNAAYAGLTKQYKNGDKYVFQPSWIEDSIKVGRPMVPLKQASPRKYRSEPFTEEDDAHLVKYLAEKVPFHTKYTMTRTGPNLYKELVENLVLYPWAERHPWASWHERYRKRTDEFDPRIDELVRRQGLMNPPLRQTNLAQRKRKRTPKDVWMSSSQRSSHEMTSEQPQESDSDQGLSPSKSKRAKTAMTSHGEEIAGRRSDLHRPSSTTASSQQASTSRAAGIQAVPPQFNYESEDDEIEDISASARSLTSASRIDGVSQRSTRLAQGNVPVNYESEEEDGISTAPPPKSSQPRAQSRTLSDFHSQPQEEGRRIQEGSQMIEGPIEVPDFNDASPSRDKPGHRNESGNGADLIDITEPVPRPQGIAASKSGEGAAPVRISGSPVRNLPAYPISRYSPGHILVPDTQESEPARTLPSPKRHSKEPVLMDENVYGGDGGDLLPEPPSLDIESSEGLHPSSPAPAPASTVKLSKARSRTRSVSRPRGSPPRTRARSRAASQDLPSCEASTAPPSKKDKGKRKAVSIVETPAHSSHRRGNHLFTSNKTPFDTVREEGEDLNENTVMEQANDIVILSDPRHIDSKHGLSRPPPQRRRSSSTAPVSVALEFESDDVANDGDAQEEDVRGEDIRQNLLTQETWILAQEKGKGRSYGYDTEEAESVVKSRVLDKTSSADLTQDEEENFGARSHSIGFGGGIYEEQDDDSESLHDRRSHEPILLPQAAPTQLLVDNHHPGPLELVEGRGEVSPDHAVMSQEGGTQALIRHHYASRPSAASRSSPNNPPSIVIPDADDSPTSHEGIEPPDTGTQALVRRHYGIRPSGVQRSDAPSSRVPIYLEGKERMWNGSLEGSGKIDIVPLNDKMVSQKDETLTLGPSPAGASTSHQGIERGRVSRGPVFPSDPYLEEGIGAPRSARQSSAHSSTRSQHRVLYTNDRDPLLSHRPLSAHSHHTISANEQLLAGYDPQIARAFELLSKRYSFDIREVIRKYSITNEDIQQTKIILEKNRRTLDAESLFMDDY